MPELMDASAISRAYCLYQYSGLARGGEYGWARYVLGAWLRTGALIDDRYRVTPTLLREVI